MPLLFVAVELCVITGAALDPNTQDAALIAAAWVVAAIGCYFLCFRRAPGA